MSREIDELRAMAQKERAEVRELGSAWKASAADRWHEFTRRHRGVAMFAALGAGYVGVRVLGGRRQRKRDSDQGAKRQEPDQGIARASLGALAALLVKSLPAIAVHASSALQRDRGNPSSTPHSNDHGSSDPMGRNPDPRSRFEASDERPFQNTATHKTP